VKLPWRTPRTPGLSLLVLAVSDRCDQRCVHCQIWTREARSTVRSTASLTLAERLAIVDEALSAGVKEVLLTGGEPLVSADLWPVSERLRAGGARLLLATNGMQLATHARRVASLFAEVYVSLDGSSPTTHDGVRGAGAFRRVAAGVAALRKASGEIRVVARSTLHAGNVREVEETVAAARELGFHAVSFLALDASSEAFGGDPGARRRLVPSLEDVDAFESTVRRLEAVGALADGFVLESPAKLLELGRYLQASAGSGRFQRPPCDAPWWSSVVEVDGTVRPCFFQPGVGNAREGLVALRADPRYREALARIEEPNSICERCVCPKRRRRGLVRRVVGPPVAAVKRLRRLTARRRPEADA